MNGVKASCAATGNVSLHAACQHGRLTVHFAQADRFGRETRPSRVAFISFWIFVVEVAEVDGRLWNELQNRSGSSFCRGAEKELAVHAPDLPLADLTALDPEMLS